MLDWRRLDSVVFDTRKLEEVRAFYENVLGLKIARYVKDGAETEDVTNNHVNYRIGHALIGFEVGEQTETGSLVLRVADLEVAHCALRERIPIAKSRDFFFIVRDPDGRSIIVEEEPGGGSRE